MSNTPQGRPTALTPSVLRKLQHAFNIGCSDREACLFAGIATSTLYKYCQEHPDFSEQKELWKDRPILMARRTVMRAISSGDAKLAWSFLQRKKNDEFDPKTGSVLRERALTLDEIEAIGRGEIEIC